MARNKKDLPAYARKFIQTTTSGDVVEAVKLFHRWLQAKNLTLEDLKVHHIDEFLQTPTKHPLQSAKQINYRTGLPPYFTWLSEKKLLCFNPAQPAVQASHDSCYAASFLSELSVQLKPSTVSGYRYNLRAFHNYLTRCFLPLEELERDDITNWLLTNENRQLLPSSLERRLIQLRVYLRWLYEHELITEHPTDLIHQADFPKLPRYLPRPLAPEVDCALQNFLAQNDSLFAKALLLMRSTGLRIGELRSLPFDCLHKDLHNNTFLKVPLGKLNNERLVPLRNTTVLLIEQMQRQNPTPRLFLVSEKLNTNTGLHRILKPLRDASESLNLSKPIQSHQLRHSAATELMSAGMSLTSIMRFLGHTDFRMTLRYAEVTQQTVLREFQHAIVQSEQRYFTLDQLPNENSLEPEILFANLIKWIQKNTTPNSKNQARLIKRLRQIKELLKDL